MTTTTIDNLIAAFALAMIVVPIIMIGVADAKRHPWWGPSTWSTLASRPRK